MSLRRTPLLRIAACLALATAAHAQTTWVVGPVLQPGVDFTEIQPAVDVAGPLDLVYVLDGDYAAFETDHGVTVMGESRANVRVSDFYPNHAPVRIHDLASQERVVLADMTFRWRLEIEACEGMVLADNLQWAGLIADASDDVRLQTSQFSGGLITDSFVQIVDCSTGSIGARWSEVTIAGSSLVGQDGTDGNSDPFTGTGPPTPGGDGLTLEHSTARVLRSTLQGGRGGIDYYGPGMNAPHGRSLVAAFGSSVTESHVHHGGPLPAYYSSDSTQIDRPDFPCTVLLGGTTVGATVSFQSFAGALTSGRLFVGRYADKTRLQAGVLPRLHTSEAGRSLGAMPASELVATSFTIPQGPKGYLFFGQTWRTLSDGQTELSNSAVLVVR